MNAYLSVENGMLRFRTSDNSINVLFSCGIRIGKIYKVNRFQNGVINIDIRYIPDYLTTSEIQSMDYDIQSVLDLMGISSKPLKKVTKVKIGKSDCKKNKYSFRMFQQDHRIYIEVTSAENKKYRSVHFSENMELVATTMPINMIDEYKDLLKNYHDSFAKNSDNPFDF